MSTRPVTQRQLQVLGIIELWLFDKGFPPTNREICAELGVSEKSTCAAHYHLCRLEAKGLILRHAVTSRGISLTFAGHELLVEQRKILR